MCTQAFRLNGVFLALTILEKDYYYIAYCHSTVYMGLRLFLEGNHKLAYDL